MSELKNCPICGEAPKLIGGPENWSPTFYDPDSGGDPYSIICECGLSLNIGMCEPEQLANLWNTRSALKRLIRKIWEVLHGRVVR